jgi:glycosyltransferase involved in cell wall biosynthesis
MKIALVTYALHIGGVESVLVSLADYFKNKGYEIEFIETSSKGEWSDEIKSRGYKVKTILINPLESRLNHSKRLSNYLNNFDVVFLNDSPFAQATIGLLRNNIKVFPILHNNIDSMIKNAMGSLDNWNKLICVSPSLENELIKRYQNSKERFITIANGVNVEHQNFKQNFNFENINVFKILYVGRIEHTQKGVLHIPDIIDKLKRKNFNIKMTIVGGGPSEKELLSKIERLNLQNEIEFLGKKKHDDVIDIMKQNHFFLMPSYYEGHPIVLMEAMSFGLIPLVTNLVGHTDIVVENKENGFLCDINYIDSFSNTLEELFQKNYNLNLLSNNAWKKIFEEYNLQKLGDNYKKLIDSAICIEKNRVVDISLLGDFPKVPYILTRPIRKLYKLLGLHKGLK